MTTPITLWKLRVVAAGLLIAIISFIYPHVSSAQVTSEKNTSIIFELKPNVLKNTLYNSNQLTIDEVIAQDELVQSVQNYLESKKSPLAPYASDIVREPNWEQALGITYVESNYCAKAANFNCGSVGVKPGHKQWKKFESPLDGFKAVTTLLEKPLYKNKYDTCKEKIGVYVVPGSKSWLNGCEKVEKEMKALTTVALAKRQTTVTEIQTNTATDKVLAIVK